MGLLVCMLGACASAPRPQTARHTQYVAYWDCAFAAAATRLRDPRLSARDVAMRAQAQCYPDYQRYQSARERFARSRVDRTASDTATRLAGHAAIQKKRDMTRRLTRWVIAQRRR